MNSIAIEAWAAGVAKALATFGASLGAFLPSLAAALVILLSGWALSWLLARVARRILHAIGVDRLELRHRGAAGVGTQQGLSDALATLVFWSIMAVVLLSSAHALGITAVTTTLARLSAFVPNLIGAALTALIGLLVARFVGSMTTSAGIAAGIAAAPRIGFLVQVVGVGVVLALAVEQLGMKSDILVLPLSALLAAAVFSAGLAFALGARPVIAHILAGHFLKQSLPRDRFIEIDGERGVVERIGPTDTLFKNGDRRWTVPNAQLLEQVVQR